MCSKIHEILLILKRMTEFVFTDAPRVFVGCPVGPPGSWIASNWFPVPGEAKDTKTWEMETFTSQKIVKNPGNPRKKWQLWLGGWGSANLGGYQNHRHQNQGLVTWSDLWYVFWWTKKSQSSWVIRAKWLEHNFAYQRPKRGSECFQNSNSSQKWKKKKNGCFISWKILSKWMI